MVEPMREDGLTRGHRSERSAPAVDPPDAGRRLPWDLLALQRLAGNRAVVEAFSVQRQGRGRGPARRPGNATPVTRVIVVTTNDTYLLPVSGAAGATVPQQEVWRRTAARLAAEPAPDGGRTVVMEVTSLGALRARLVELARTHARVARFDFVGHGHPQGFNLSGTQAAVQQWVSADDIAGLIQSTGVSRGVTSLSVEFRACYTDQVAHRLAAALGRAGFRAADVRGVSGSYQPGYAPPQGHGTVRDRRNWQVRDPGTNVRGGQPDPTLRPGDLRGL